MSFLPKDYQAPKCPILEQYEQAERGNRSHFVRLGITMDPEMVSHLKTAGAKLQAKGYSDTDLSSLIRCACKELLSKIEEFFDVEQQNKWIENMNDAVVSEKEIQNQK